MSNRPCVAAYAPLVSMAAKETSRDPSHLASITLGLTALIMIHGDSTASAAAPPQHRELGDVRFERDLASALVRAQRESKPVLILFDEIPGCSTCVSYGETVLTHPLLVEAIETSFIPVAIFNNRGGADRAALDSFREPAWNNPVIRIVDAELRMLAPRVSGDYTAGGLARAMVVALQAAKRGIPEWLTLVAQELDAEKRGATRLTLETSCFWAGEACLGEIEGVVDTRTGFVDGREAVEVAIDPERTSVRELLARAKAAGCAHRVWVAKDEDETAAREVFGPNVLRTPSILRTSEKDDKHHLASTTFARVPMTPLQATRANSRVARGADPSPLLSPVQRAMHEAVRAARSRAPQEAFRRGDLRARFLRARE